MKFPSLSRLFGADWRARASRRKGRRSQAGRAKPPSARLILEGLEDRTLMAVLPSPVVSNPQVLLPGGGTAVNPAVVIDPVNPQKVFAVFQQTIPNPPFSTPPSIQIEGAFSNNGGA